MVAGCRYPLDRLYALPLDREPAAADWAGAVPLALGATGGSSTAPADRDVDADAVHVTTASCHHGAQVPPVPVELRAFWTPDRVYLQIRWDDPTPSRAALWRWDGRGWRASPPGADGVGVLWGGPAAAWNCTQVCHLRDWRMAGDRALADYTMSVGPEAEPLDFWIWRAGFGTVAGVAVDAVLSELGRLDDGGEPTASFRPNSVRATSGVGPAFADGDRPVEAPRPVPGAQVAGYLAGALPAGRSEVTAEAEWNQAGWVVTLSRVLSGADPGDVAFVPGGDYVFGLSIMDAVDVDHLVVPEPIRLRLVRREARNDET